MSVLRPSTVVELGSRDGFSFGVWCQAVDRLGLLARCYAVDTWKGDADTGESDEAVYLELVQYHQKTYPAFSSLIRSTVDDALDHFPDGSIDLLHIDGQRAYERAHRDFESWRKKMSVGGVVVIHESNAREGDSGVAQWWSEISRQFPSFEFLHGHGLGILAVGEEISTELQALFATKGESADEVREIYARLGRAIAMQQAQSEVHASSRHELQQTHGLLVGESKNRERQRSELTELSARLERLEQELHDERSRADELQRDLELEKDAHVTLTRSMKHVSDEVTALRASASWRLTAPVRLASTSLRRTRSVVSRARLLSTVVADSVRQDGWQDTLRRIVAASRRNGIGGLLRRGVGSGALPTSRFRSNVPIQPAIDRLALRVLIIAETSIPQCLKYRVTQKQRMIESLGIDCSVVSWTDTSKCMDLLQTHSIVIFYRVPGFPLPMQMVEHAKALGLVSFWEVDDLIFDAEKYILNSNLHDVGLEAKRGVLSGVPLYRQMMLACDFSIASTQGLSDAMLEAGVRETFVIENALDRETMRVAASINAKPGRKRDGFLRIVYGSGTKTHDADFRAGAPGIKMALRQRPNVKLRIIGELGLPDDFAEVASQIERLPSSRYAEYLSRLADCDISIAPLESSVFNDAKSNIKYLEASVVKLPSVCSPAAAFRTAISHGETGFLAETPAAWCETLLALIDNADLRRDVAARAYEHVSVDYSPKAISERQVVPLLAPYMHKPAPLRVLGVNVYFEPRSFGGATIIAEAVARRINSTADMEYFMFTSLPANQVQAYSLVRYEARAGGVFGMGLPPESDPTYGFENPKTVPSFREAVRAVRPDMVHLHSIQGIGASIAEVCQEEKIPFVVTLHDAWWICGRQFMITGEQRYCFQRKIDLSVCAKCVDDPGVNTYRQFRLHDILKSAAMLLVPSEFFRGLFIDNGFDPAKIVLNRNGIQAPETRIERARLAGRPLRFGYVGGETPIKGAQLIKDALQSMSRSDYELTVVDNARNLGMHTIETHTWKVPGKLRVVPAYTQETIDEFFAGIDVLLFPTQCKESFGMTVREALVRDVWVISTDAGGAVEDIVPGENGQIISLTDDPAELVAAISALLDNPGRLESYRNPYKDRIRFFDEQADELHRLLGDAIAGARGQRSAATMSM
ncbi:glycosyltransferase [Caballeronia novacaledonica]|uniref:Glycosyltransferase n=1 Tax=Caballeronia novacaledonica TaxID=1544861 RepID=A0AA37IBE9_9BURK|nr:glycosyltransferase [Caballeronia novacaledonica]GJH26032.1 glycosyltransferase [Caballeronia novacaledonica]